MVRNAKSIFFAVWLLLVAGVVVALAQQDRFFAKETPALAKVATRTGVVSVRPEGIVRWREVDAGHGLHDGDKVATGPAATTKVTFGEGRALILGEETQVQIRAIMQEGKDYAFSIDLLRGTAVAQIDAVCKTCQPLVIGSGGEKFSVALGKKVGLFKAAGKKTALFDPKGPWPLQPVKKKATIALIDKSFLSAKAPDPEPPPPAPTPPLPKPKAEPKPKEKEEPKALEKAAGFEVKIAAAGGSSGATPGKVWWTTQPITALGGTTLEFPIARPTTLPTEGKWAPVVELGGEGGAKGQIVTGLGPNDTVVKLPIERIRRAATRASKGGYVDYAFSLRGGAVITRDKEKSESFSNARTSYRIRTFGEFPGGPVSVGLDKLSPVEAGGSPWIDAKAEIAVGAAPIAIHLASAGGDYGKLLPYIRGASSIGIARAGFASAVGNFVVRNQTVVAQLSGGALEKGTISTMRQLLGGEFVFKGSRTALQDTRGSSQNDLVGVVNALLDKGKVLYILKRNKIYPVSRDFIKTNAEVAQFIDSQAKAVFLEKVEILDYR